VTRTRLLIAVAALIAATALGAYLSWRPHTAAPSGAGPAVQSPQSPGLRGTDAAWLSLMISMNDSTMVLLDSAPAKLTDPGLKAFVTSLAASHRAELDDMRARADRAHLFVSDDHAGHELPGVVTPDDLTTIDAQTGAAYDAAVRQCLREHLEQGAKLSVSEQANGTDDSTRELAKRLEQARRADVTRLAG
jgi:hypothetical protein